MTTDPDRQWREWRAENARHLSGFQLLRQPYQRWSAEWDHDHCAACGDKFVEGDGEGQSQEGYATTEDYPKGARYEWVCVRCFNDLSGLVAWVSAG